MLEFNWDFVSTTNYNETIQPAFFSVSLVIFLGELPETEYSGNLILPERPT